MRELIVEFFLGTLVFEKMLQRENNNKNKA